MNNQIKYFTDPSLLQQLGHNRLARFFQDFELDLRDAGNRLPFPSPDDPTSLDRLAAAFARTESLPEKMREALHLIEAAAAPENGELLESVIQRRLPCISLNRLCPLDAPLELWFTCPDELPQFLPQQSAGRTAEASTGAVEPGREVSQKHPHSPNAAAQEAQPSGTPSPGGPRSAKRSEELGHPNSGGVGNSLGRGEGELSHSVIHNSLTTQPTGATLLDDLVHLLTRFVVLPKHAPEALALWIVHTYAFQLRDVSVYIGIESPEKRCGKTTLLTVLSELAQNAIAASNISPPAFFRVIEDLSPTLLIDEADTFLNGNDALRGILNAGYKKKTAFVYRATNEHTSSETGKDATLGESVPKPSPFHADRSPSPGAADEVSVKMKPFLGRGEGERPFSNSFSTFSSKSGSITRFSSWCPKAIATIDRLPDTLADRCILIRMHRKARNEECDRFRNLDAEPLRQQCARFVHDHADQIAAATPASPSDLSDRAAEIWEPLFALADLAGGEWPQRARTAAFHLAAAAQQSSPIGSLLLDISVGFYVPVQTDRMLSRDIVQRLNSLSDRPWMEPLRGKPVTDRWLSQQLGPYGIKPRVFRLGDSFGRGYFSEDFKSILGRYVSKAEFRALYPQAQDEPEEPK